MTLEGRRRKLAAARLYFVCDARPRNRSLDNLLAEALANGADMVQLRDKDLDEDAQELGDEAPDYISVGPIWETPTKQGRPGVGLELIDTAARIARLPWFAIGGIDPGNVGAVVAAGARRVVVVRAIRDAEDPAA